MARPTLHRGACALAALALLAGCAAQRPEAPKTLRGPFPEALAEQVRASPEVVLGADCESGGVPAGLLAAYVYRRAFLAAGPADREAVRCATALAAGAAGTTTPDDVAALRRFQRALALGVPGAAVEEPGADAGTRLLDVLAAADPVLATADNERLAEHLGRIGEAHFRYPDPAAPTGLDARGEVFVRLGPPAGHEVIDFHSAEMLRRIRALESSVYNGFRVSPSEFADNEFWVYDRPERFHFLFVNDSGTFRLGTTMDLIPQRFRMGVDGSTGRGGARADILLEVLRTVFRQLSPYSVEYGARFNELDGYVGQLEAAQIEALGQAERDPSGGTRIRRLDSAALVSDDTNVARGVSSAPDQFARSMVAEVVRGDQVDAARRAEVAPDVQSALFWPPLALDARVARFLSPRGETRLDVDWAADLGPYRGLADSVDVAWTAVAQADGGAAPRRERRDLMVATAADPIRDRPHVLTTSVVIPGEPSHVAAEWAVLDRARPDGPAAAVIGVGSFDGLAMAPLRADGIEVSDLRPLESVGSVPYPFARVVPGLPLAVYFEIYGLDGQRGQFRVDYTVTRSRRGTLLRRGTRDAEAGRLISRGDGGRSGQFLILETTQWDGADTVVVEVVVTSRDGERRVRTVTFEVVEG